MAKNVFYSFPIDTPAITKKGLRYREADAPGNASHLYVGPEDPIRQEKGDLGLSVIKDFEPRPLTGGGLPFANLKGGK